MAGSETSFLRRLIQAPSPSGQEGPAITEIQRLFGEMNINHTQVFSPEDLHHEKPPVILVHIPGTNSQNLLVFDGHVDTVQTDRNSWTVCPPHGPGSGAIQDGRMYGAGASDMKAGVAGMLMLAEKFALEKPPCDLMMGFVPEEETSGYGTSALVKHLPTMTGNYGNIGVIFPESTGLKKLYIGQRGNMTFDVQAEAPGGHAARYSGANPIDSLVQFLAETSELHGRWSEEYPDELFGPPSLRPTVFQAGESSNVVPNRARAVIDVRTNPDMQDIVIPTLTEIARICGVELNQRWTTAPAFTSDPASDLVRIVQEVSGVSPSIFPATSDMAWFYNAGYQQVLCHGPGSPETIHSPNENVLLEDIQTWYDRAVKIIDRWAEVGK